jgi:hypothetical protein
MNLSNKSKLDSVGILVLIGVGTASFIAAIAIVTVAVHIKLKQRIELKNKEVKNNTESNSTMQDVQRNLRIIRALDI